MTRRLYHTTRQSIAKKMHEGSRPQVLAREYGVTVRTVYRCAQFMREIQIERGTRTQAKPRAMSFGMWAAWPRRMPSWPSRCTP